MKLRDVKGFLGASTAALVVLMLIALRVTGCTPLAASGLARMGLCGGTMRLPMTPLAADNEPVVEAAMRASGLL